MDEKKVTNHMIRVNDETYYRLKAIQLDLKLRGPGDAVATLIDRDMNN